MIGRDAKREGVVHVPNCDVTSDPSHPLRAKTSNCISVLHVLYQWIQQQTYSVSAPIGDGQGEGGVCVCVHLYSDFPIVVVATSSKPTAITAQVAMEMLHVVKIDPPTEAERLAMLRGLAGDYLTAPDILWPQLARHTAVSGPSVQPSWVIALLTPQGFVLGDLVSLFSRAGHIATSSAIEH